MQTTHTTFEYSSLNVLKAIYEERIYLTSKSLKGTLKGTSIDLNIFFSCFSFINMALNFHKTILIIYVEDH